MKKYFGAALVGAIVLSLCMATTSQAVFIESIADVFQGDFTAPGPLPVTSVGLATPNGGAITFYANGDAQGTSSLVTSGNVFPGGVGPGWEDSGSIIGYARGGPWGVGPGAGDAIVGHGGDGATLNPAEQKVDYTVPISGLYDLTVNIQQPWEAARSMRLQLFNNDFTGAGAALADIEAGGTTGPAPGVSSTVSSIALNAGDILTVIVDGSGPSGTQVGTWVGFNLTVAQIPEPASLALMGFGLSGIMVMSGRRSKMC